MSIVIICIYPKIKAYITLNSYLILESGKSGNAIIDNFILKNELRWIPYNKFENVEYLNEGGFGTIYKAVWLGNEEVILKCHKKLNENLNEFLEEVYMRVYYFLFLI
ncbi:hypothetical protein RhiirA4_482266 [Rhizophagus irregularis]|uniref:Protein kinase domain-containing protein n=1 Tax=Rhizophagus irregularis TaxID=588596 RepID=A0A2I1HKU0_9GLOM|nr:hypothetical protein RhiirA4_482266 [Rhizophagus irregularis]